MRTFTKLKCLGAILLSIMLLTPVGSQVFAQQILSYHKADQQKSLTSNRRAQEISLTHILKQLEAKHQVHLNYDWNSLKGKTLNIRLKLSDNLSKDLNAILPKFDLTYKKVKKNYYVIFPSNEAKSSWKEGKRSKTSREIPKIPNKKLDNLDQTNLNQNSLNNYQKEIVRIIQGVVQDDEGEPLPGVNIVVKGTSIGTLTDVNGAYNINVPEGDNQILIFSFVGYKAQEIAVNNQTSINVKMEADVAIMDEVVVIGYGTQQKRDLVSSVAKVEGKDLENVPNSRVDQILQGRATGVLVTQTSGEPGAATTIRVRGGNSIQGDNEPLWVIDGIIVGTDFNLNNLNSNDIKSIEILKDATAISIYGTRGANGVILVTTKSGVGVSPGKPQVSANFYAGVQDVIAIPEFLDGPEFAAYANEDAEFRNATLPFQDLDAVPNVDWFDLVTQSAPIYNADISVSGSSEDGGLNYYVSGNYFNQEGTVRGSGIEKYIFRTNLDFKLSSKIKAGLRLNVARLIRENNKVNVDGLFGSLLPVRAVRDENGDFTAENPVSASIQTNAIADIELRHNQRTITNILASAYLEYKPIKQLTIRSSFSPTLNYYKENRYNPGALPQNQQQQTGGDARIQSSMDQDWLNENTVTYSGKIGKDHKITVLGGVTAQKTTVEFAREDAGGIPYDVTTFNNLDVGSDPELYVSHSQFTGRSLVSVLGRINYSYKGRYLVTLVGRQDWSSVFAPGNKGEFFPSIGVAWIMSEEPFIQNLNVFDLLKLRASYGRAGSQAIGPYRTLAVLSRNNSSFNASEQSGLVLGRPENPNLFWETTQQLDLGLEASFFKGRLNVELDYYYKKTSDLLLNVQIPRQTGFNSRLQNLGEVENRGLELLISSTNISTADFSWNTSLTLSGNRNKVVDLAGSEFINVVTPTNQGGVGARLIVGQPAPVFVGVRYLGTWKTQEEIDASGIRGQDVGGPRFEDVDGNGVVNQEDFYVIGNPQPDFIYGLQNDFTYKNWRLSFFIQGTVGNDIYNSLTQTAFFGRPETSKYAETANRWSETNSTSNVPRAGAVAALSEVVSNTELIEDGTHLRLKNIMLSYTLPMQKWGIKQIQDMSIYFSGTNLFVLSGFRLKDPEANRYGRNNLQQGFSNGEYPNPRILSLGIKATFQ